MKFFAKGRLRWIFFVMVGLVVATVGLKLGKTKEGEYIDALYARSDFTLIDDADEFFTLKDFPKEKLLLLLFTPDVLNPEVAIAMRPFSSHLKDLQKRGVETMLVTRTNREVARNFKYSAQFRGRMLVDLSGTVGKNIGAWPMPPPSYSWGYALIDNQMRVYWLTIEHNPLTYQVISDQLNKMK
jgi:peroxiredoxin